MAWKVIAIIESRAGDLEILPDWCIGTLNSFDNVTHATLVRDSMQQIVDANRSPRVPGHAEAPKLPPIKYMLVPTIDQNLIDQLNGKQPAPQQQQQNPALSFGAPPQA